MPKCVKCGVKYGFGPFTIFSGGTAVHCPTCKMQWQEFQKLYGTWGTKRKSCDPKDTARIAALHLLCAEWININRTTSFTLPGSDERVLIHESFTASKANAIWEAKRCLESLPNDSPGVTFPLAVLKRAEDLSSSPVKGVQLEEDLQVPRMFSFTLPLEDLAIIRANLFTDDLNNYIRTIDGHEWLTG